MAHQKTVLITGATAGIGLACAQHFLTQGWNVIITGRNPEKIAGVCEQLNAHQRPGQLSSVLCDSADLQQIQSMAERLQRDNIRLDALILNAGVFYPALFTESTEALFDETFAINVKGPFFTLQALLPVMNNPSSVVLISSVAVRKAFATASVYSASKAAIEGYAGVLNAELAEQGIRINSIRPGVTITEIQSKAGMSDQAIAELSDSMSATPLGRVLTAQDIVPAVAYLASEGSEGLRNAHLDVEGGFAL